MPHNSIYSGILRPYKPFVEIVVEKAAVLSKRPNCLVEDFNDLLRQVGHDLYGNAVLNHNSNLDSLEQYTKIFLSTQNWKDHNFFNGYSVSTLASCMKNDSSASARYESLTPDAQQFMLHMFRSRNLWPARLYLDALSKIGSQPTHLIRYDNHKEYPEQSKNRTREHIDRALKEILENSTNPDLVSHLDLSPCSMDFVETVTSSQAGYLIDTNIHAVELFTLWRAIYSEEVVMKVIRDFSKYYVRIRPNDLLKIMDNWEYWSAFPAEWIIEVQRTDAEKISS